MFFRIAYLASDLLFYRTDKNKLGGNYLHLAFDFAQIIERRFMIMFYYFHKSDIKRSLKDTLKRFEKEKILPLGKKIR